MKKFFYGILIFFVSLIVIIVVAANSSFVIKKAADAFAPDYNITYDDITGNVFTGVKINGLKYADMHISKQIRFSWNPSKILYKRIAISEISGENIDVDSVKALIASFPASEDNSSSEPFPLVVTVGKVHVSVNPFVEQGILFEKTRLDAEDIFYASDEVEVGDLQLRVDSNVTDLKLHASLKDGKVTVEDLSLDQIDSETLQGIFMPVKSDSDGDGDRGETKEAEKKEPLNPLIPTEVEVKHFSAMLKPRNYLDASIDRMKVTIDDMKADIVKILDNKKSAVSVGNYILDLKSDMGQVDIEGMLKNDTVTLKKVNIVKVDTMALKSMFMPDSNETNTTEASEEVAQTETNEENNSTVAEKKNNLIPQKIVLRSLHADVLPATFKPVHILAFALDANRLKVDLEKLLVEEGEIDLNGTTNLTNFSEKGKIRNNQLKGHIVLTPNQTLFDLYELPLRKEAIGDIRIDFGASKEKVSIDLAAKAKHILLVRQDANQTDSNTTDLNASKPFNVDIDHLKAHLVYQIEEKKADANADIQVTTPYAKAMTLKSTFSMADSAMQYKGILKVGQIEGLDAKLVKPANNLQIDFNGNEKQVETTIDSDGLKGYFNVPDFKKSGKFHLETKTAVEVGKMVALPAELNATKVDAVIDVPLNFAKLVPIKGKAKITSNVADLSADLVYDDTVTLDVLTTIPKDSLLKNFDKNVRWSAVSPLKIKARMGEKDIAASLIAPKISADMKMLPFAGTVDGKVRISGVTATLKGDKSGTITLKSDVSSFKTLLGTVNQFYRVDNLPKVEGKLDLSVVLQKSGDAVLHLTSPQVVYHADRKTVHNIDDVKVSIGTQKGNKLLLKSYQLTYNKMKFFASKPSEVTFKDQTITVAQLWLNDQLKVTGQLNTKTMKGEILADAPTFHFAHEMIDLDSRINIKTKFNGPATDVNGKVTLLGGDVHYDLGTKSFPSDSDILIVQEMKKKEPSPFMDNLSMHILIDSEKPLVYKQGDIDMQANVDMKILKAIKSEPLVLGDVKLVKGGTYDFEGKRFVVKKGDIYFTGDPSKPLLDVEVEYQAENYLITITVSGTPAVPVINFSSRPSLTREQILSVILFDSEEGAGSNSSEDMMKMMGGAMAKSALANAGVKIDYLSLGTDGSMEIGKKITDKITVIYVNDEVSSVRMKYRHSPRTESVLEFDEISQSYDIVYRRDMSTDDIIMLGREKK